MTIENRLYFRDRADQEMIAAANAASPSISAIHADLARRYIARSKGPIEAVDFSTPE